MKLLQKANCNLKQNNRSIKSSNLYCKLFFPLPIVKQNKLRQRKKRSRSSIQNCTDKPIDYISCSPILSIDLIKEFWK